MKTGRAKFTLRLGKNTYNCDIEMPAGPTRVVDVLPILNSVVRLVVDSAVEETTDEGKTITCKAGCGACCRQPVPVSLHEAEALLKVIAGMEPERRARVQGRFEEGIRKLGDAGLIEGLAGIQALDDAARRELALKYFALGVACPFLEEESCSIYEHRPMRCREYLVTSPAEHCASPSPETVKMVQLKGAPSQALYRLAAGDGKGEAEVVVMTLLPEWKGPVDPKPTVEAPRILQTFLQLLGGAEPKSEAKPE